MQTAFAPIDHSAGNSFATANAQSSGDANSRLRSDAIDEVTSRKSKFSFSGVPRTRVLLTLNQLAVMSQNGIEIADAVENVAANCVDDRLADSLERIHESINSGMSFSLAVAKHGEHFPPTLAPMLSAAEASGEVPETLKRVTVRMREEMRGTITGALIYPAILISASLIVITALVLGVLPQFSRVFDSMGKTVPFYTQWLLNLGEFMRAYWMLITPALIVSMTSAFVLRKNAIIQKPLGRFLMYAPLIRDAYRPLQAGRNLRTISAMVYGGVPMLQAVQLSRRASSDVYWQDLLQQMEDRLIDGLSASSALTDIDFIPPETAQLLATGERTGRIAEVLEDIGEFYEQEASRHIKRLVTALEPAVILIMGVIVAGIVMSVMLPLLDISTIQS